MQHSMVLAWCLRRRRRRRERRLRLRVARKAALERRLRWNRLGLPQRRRGKGLLSDFAALLGTLEDFEEEEIESEYLEKVKLEFRHVFRITWDAFEYVHAAVEPDLRSRAPPALARGRLKFWTSQEKLLVALYSMASGATYEVVADVFRDGLSTKQVQRFVVKASEALVNRLASVHIRTPQTSAELETVAKEIERWSGFPHCMGIIDGTHIPVSPKFEDQASHINRKSWYSILVSVLADGKGRIINQYTGTPGRMSDTTAFWHSALGKYASQNRIPAPYYIMGDSIYPFKRWLQKGYPRASSYGLPRRLAYNEKFSQTRWVVEFAIGKLKGQWRCLYTGLRLRKKEDWCSVTTACIVLHNITIDKCDQGLRPGVRRAPTSNGNIFRRDPDDVGNDPAGNAGAGLGASAVRERLAEHVMKL